MYAYSDDFSLEAFAQGRVLVHARLYRVQSSCTLRKVRRPMKEKRATRGLRSGAGQAPDAALLRLADGAKVMPRSLFITRMSDFRHARL